MSCINKGKLSFLSLIFTICLYGTGLTAAALPLNGYSPLRDTFPDFSMGALHVAVPIQNLQFYSPDDANFFCDSAFHYTITGNLPGPGQRWFIDVSSGTQDCQGINTPYALLCRLLGAYQSSNLQNILSLYHPSTMAEVSEILSDTAIAARYDSLVSAIGLMEILVGYQSGPGFSALVNLYTATDTMVSLFFFQQDQGSWFLASITDSLPMTINLTAYVQKWHPSGLIGTTDIDNDGVTNTQDNCPCIPNPNQEDSDGDGIGDTCDICPFSPNPEQNDSDGDGIGDACDNCPFYPNPLQEDIDLDMRGDSCDNCPAIPNFNQRDTDEDNIGDLCDDDIDGDGYMNEYDDDIDGDGVLNEDDNCLMIPNPGQEDFDQDGIGDFCDNCPSLYNPEQADMDNDGIGDLCDPDRDGDGILNFYDNCPDTYNPGQEDVDCNGIGDICE